MTMSRILNLAHYGQWPDESISDARWQAMVNQARAEHEWRTQNTED